MVPKKTNIKNLSNYTERVTNNFSYKDYQDNMSKISYLQSKISSEKIQYITRYERNPNLKIKMNQRTIVSSNHSCNLDVLLIVDYRILYQYLLQ